MRLKLLKVFSLFLFVTSFLFAEGDYSDVHFTDIEENMTLLLVNHADYNTLYGILKNSTDVKNILNERFNNRFNGGITSIGQLDDIHYISGEDLYNLKQYSYKFFTQVIFDSNLGVTFNEYNFLIGLISVLAGFTFLFWSIYIFIDVAKK